MVPKFISFLVESFLSYTRVLSLTSHNTTIFHYNNSNNFSQKIYFKRYVEKLFSRNVFDRYVLFVIVVVVK